MKRKHRDYDNDFPSVTTVLGVLRNMSLEYWFRANTPEFINRESAKGKKIGTDIHQAIENYITTGIATVDTEYPDEVNTALQSFVMFKRFYPELNLKNSEIKLTSKLGFNGTIDCQAHDQDGKLLILDWKSSKAGEKDLPDIYDSYLYQVSAYVHLWNENYPESFIKEAIIVSIAKDKICFMDRKMELKEIEECFNKVFIPCLNIYNYQHKKDN